MTDDNYMKPSVFSIGDKQFLHVTDRNGVDMAINIAIIEDVGAGADDYKELTRIICKGPVYRFTPQAAGDVVAAMRGTSPTPDPRRPKHE